MNILLFNWNNVLTDVEAELKRRGHTVLPIDGRRQTMKKSDVMVFWNETDLGGWRDFIRGAKRRGIKTVLVQHGRRGTSRIYPPFNELPESDVVCVWSENDRKRLISVGVDPKKIKVTGTTIWRHLIPRVPHEGKNVVYSPEHWDREPVENLIVADELRKLKRVKILTKILRGEQSAMMYDNPIESDRNGLDHFDIVMRTLSIADVVVSISESTFELIAEAMDIPVVIADCWIPKTCDGDERYKDYHREYSDACTRAKLKDLNKAVIHELKHPGRLREERKKIAVNDGGIGLDAVGNIVNVIESI